MRTADGEIGKEELRAGFRAFTPLRKAPGLGNYNEEFVSEIHADADSLFNAIDIDGNGQITEAELRVHLREFSNFADTVGAAPPPHAYPPPMRQFFSLTPVLLPLYPSRPPGDHEHLRDARWRLQR